MINVRRVLRVPAACFLVTAVVLFEIGMAQTMVHEMKVTFTIPPAVELRIENEDGFGALPVQESPTGLEAVLHVILCTNAPPTQLYLELSNHVSNLYYLVAPGQSTEGARAWMLATQPRCWLGTVTTPGEHPFTLRFKLEGELSDRMPPALSISLVAQDHLGTEASQEVRIPLLAGP